jgi:hypothetical protein
MAKEHFDLRAVESDDEFWKQFQEHMGYSDEDIAIFRSDPHRSRLPRIMTSSEMRNATMVVEVTDSYGCAEGMQPGDKLYFTGLARLDPTRSSPWCAHALVPALLHANECQTLIVNGIDPNAMYWPTQSCEDCGVKSGGWGRVSMKTYVIEEKADDNK